ncbi:MAG: DUF1983 domain-containing protein [Ramlibacter sp.]|nr:DUF1983 domain-containing protein [Ramlibacter sp.]
MSTGPVKTTATATRRATLPGLRLPAGVPKDQSDFFKAVKERLEVREGERGNPFERALTRRDLRGELETLGIVVQPTARTATGVPVGSNSVSGGGAYSPEVFAESIRNTKLYRDLLRRIDDPARFNDFPEKTRALLLQDIAGEAAKRGAEIRRLDEQIQEAGRSFAQSIQEVTAATATAAAGVRQVAFASANENRATAGVVTQVQARLDDFDGGGATVEEYAIAIADRTTGLEAQKVIKVTAGNAIAGIGIAATDPGDGNATSAVIILADKFAIVGADDIIANPLAPDASRIPFGIDTANDVIYINGQVRINAGGRPLDELGLVLRVTAPTQTFKRDAGGTWDASSITLTATLGGGLTGTPNWSVVSGTYGGSLASGSTLAVARSSMSTDQVTFRATVTSGGTDYTDDFTILLLKDGETGEDAVSGFLTNETHTVPASSTGVPSSYAGAGGTFKVFDGLTDVTTSAAFSVQSNPNGLTTSINATTGVYSVTATGSWLDALNVATITYRATYNGVDIDKVMTLTKAIKGDAGFAGSNGSDGTRGSVTLYASGSSWSDSTANSAITSATGSSTKVIGDTVTISNGSSFAATKYWSGSAWVDPGVVINGNLLVTGTVSASAIAANTITTDKLYVNAATVVSAGSNVNNSVSPASTDTSATITGSTAMSITTTGTPLRIDARVTMTLQATNSAIEYFYALSTVLIDGTPYSADNSPVLVPAFNFGGFREGIMTVPIILRASLSAATHTIKVNTSVEARDASGASAQFGSSTSLNQYVTVTGTENKV